MLARWAAGAEMVYAVRETRADESWAKRAGARWFYKLLSGARGVDVPAHAGDFRLMDRSVVDALNALPERTRFMKGLYAWVGFKGEALPYTPDERLHGNSRFSGLRLFRLALDGLTAFTTWPLRMVSLAGVVMALVGLCYAAYLVGEYLLLGNPVSGWTTIVTAVLFFAGINLISLGVVGEYVARIFDEVKGGRSMSCAADRASRLQRRGDELMAKIMQQPARSEWTPPAGWFLLAIGAWLAALIWYRPLTLPDEGRYAGVAWDMLRAGSHGVPLLDGMPYFHKPPLYYWLSEFFFALFGPHPWLARLPSWMAAWGTSIALYFFVLRHRDRATATMTTLILACMPFFYGGAQFANLDMLVAGMISLCVLAAAETALRAERVRPIASCRWSPRRWPAWPCSPRA